MILKATGPSLYDWLTVSSKAMKTLILTLVIALFSITNSFAQLPNETPQSKFENDVKNNKVTLYILGGIAARVYEGDAKFSEK